MNGPDDDFSPEEAYRVVFRAFSTPAASRHTEGFRPSKQFDVTNAFIHELVQPHSEPDVELWDERKPPISFPIILSVLGLCTIVTNAIFLFSFFAYRRVRTGPNLMLLNIAVADLVFVFAVVPVAILNYTAQLNVGTGPDSSEYPSATHLHVCRFVHYVILVSVYVSNYTIVVTCLFIFFDGLLRVKRKGQLQSLSTTMPRINNGKQDASLTNTHAVLSCAVVWVAFVASHLNFLVQRDRPMFEEPLICKHTEDKIDAVNLRTHWMTFMTCAFLIPLLVVGSLSLMIIQRGGVRNADPCRISLSRGPRLLALTRKIKPSIKNTYYGGRFVLRETNPVAAKRYHNNGGHQFTNQTYAETVMGPELAHQQPEFLPAAVDGISPCLCPEHTYSTLKRADRDTPRNTTPQGMRHSENGESTTARKPPHNQRRQPQETDEEVLESAEGSIRDARTRRDIMIVILVSIVVRFLCWLPMLIVMLIEVFGAGEGSLMKIEKGHDSGEEGSSSYHVARIFAICLVFVAGSINAFVYNYVSADYRRVNVRLFSACLCCSRNNRGGQ